MISKLPKNHQWVHSEEEIENQVIESLNIYGKEKAKFKLMNVCSKCSHTVFIVCLPNAYGNDTFGYSPWYHADYEFCAASCEEVIMDNALK